MTKTRGSKNQNAFRMTIHDVLEYEEWANEEMWSLQSVCQSRLGTILKNRRCRGMRSGEVIFFVSEDKLRARTMLCLSKGMGIYSIGTTSFGKQSPELVMSLWLGDRLRSVGMVDRAEDVDAMTAEERHEEWMNIKARDAEIR